MILIENEILRREQSFFAADVSAFEKQLSQAVTKARFLVIGGAGTIGQAVVKEIFKRMPAALHVIDISENNLVELVRDLRSSAGYSGGDFQTLPLDMGSLEFEAFLDSQADYDYVLNLAALKHVRSEKDAYTLMRLIRVNLLDTVKLLQRSSKAEKYFAVSTDKAADPVNMMGASKRLMELFLFHQSAATKVSTARFANVAFSDGSLLHGFLRRIEKRQPLAGPSDIRRYFVTREESGQLCLMSCLLGENREIFFPKLEKGLEAVTFKHFAYRLLESMGYEPYECTSEEEARKQVTALLEKKKWPVYFTGSDTTGEKEIEYFFTEDEELDLGRFETIGVVKAGQTSQDMNNLLHQLTEIQEKKELSRSALINLFQKYLPNFKHQETGKFLDQKM